MRLHPARLRALDFMGEYIDRVELLRTDRKNV